MDDIQTIQFEDDGKIPNNASLPLVLYRGALPESDSPACQRMFKENGWGSMWVNGVFAYHHYHSTAHEALGVIGGTADIQFGGERGNIVRVQTGDVVIIPAGVGHCNLDSSPDFRVIGAYPRGQNWDLCTGAPAERPQVIHNIRSVPLPEQDPVFGGKGFLLEVWRGAS